jgi:hypothetical protein
VGGIGVDEESIFRKVLAIRQTYFLIPTAPTMIILRALTRLKVLRRAN